MDSQPALHSFDEESESISFHESEDESIVICEEEPIGHISVTHLSQTTRLATSWVVSNDRFERPSLPPIVASIATTCIRDQRVLDTYLIDVASRLNWNGRVSVSEALSPTARKEHWTTLATHFSRNVRAVVICAGPNADIRIAVEPLNFRGIDTYTTDARDLLQTQLTGCATWRIIPGFFAVLDRYTPFIVFAGEENVRCVFITNDGAIDVRRMPAVKCRVDHVGFQGFEKYMSVDTEPVYQSPKAKRRLDF